MGRNMDVFNLTWGLLNSWLCGAFSPPSFLGSKFFHSILSVSNTLRFSFLFNPCFILGSFFILSSNSSVESDLLLNLLTNSCFFNILGCEFSIYFWFTWLQGFPRQRSFQDLNPKAEDGLPGFSPLGTFCLTCPTQPIFCHQFTSANDSRVKAVLLLVSPLCFPVFRVLNTS